ncbi:MAG: FHA domain-containing protein [Ideonella sp.]|nr:FHA domain-containing protein [Ideonella sp.]
MTVPSPAARLAQAEVVDAGGQGVRLIDVHAWPLAIGRALDNDIVLPDPHVAAHHATLAPGDDGRLRLQVGESRNGVRIEHGRTRAQLRAGEQAALPALARVQLGHSQLLLRLPGDALAAELPLAPSLAPAPRWLLPGLVLAAVAWLLAARWIASDPDTRWNDYLAPLVATGALLLLWCLAWGLASKLFTGRFTLAPHLRLALMFGLAVQALDVLLMVLSFSLDWPLLSHLRMGASFTVGAVWVAQHLRLVLPRHARAAAAWVAACTAVGFAVAMATSWRRNDRLLEELYAPNLMPPSWRLVRGAPVPQLIDELRSLERPLRERAAKAQAEDFEP